MKYSLFVHTYNDDTDQFLRLMESDDLAVLAQALSSMNSAWPYNPALHSYICEFFIAHGNDRHKRLYQYEIDELTEEDK